MNGDLSESVTKLALLEAEQKAEIMVLWALGDGQGPICDEVKIGICKRRAFDSQVKAMRAARWRPLATRCEVYIRGEAAALRLKTAVFFRLREIGTEIAPPWFAAAGLVDGIVRECAAIEAVDLLTEDEARAIEQAAYERVISRILGRFE